MRSEKFRNILSNIKNHKPSAAEEIALVQAAILLEVLDQLEQINNKIHPITWSSGAVTTTPWVPVQNPYITYTNTTASQTITRLNDDGSSTTNT